jgi:hypothetical protein
MAWHATCYRQLLADKFPVHGKVEDQVEDEMYDEFDTKIDLDRYKTARDGDDFMIGFQCDVCQFRNMLKRDPTGDLDDNFHMLCIRRVILDSFWSRERTTVEANNREGRQVDRAAARLGYEDPYGIPRGPFPVEDSWGVRIACMSLSRSLAPGINAPTIQHSTMRKMRTHFSNYINTTPHALGAAVLAGEKKRTQRFTTSATYSYWFGRWDEGCHTRMGDVLIPDLALTIDVLLKLQEVWEDVWSNPFETETGKLQVALIAMAVTSGYSGGLRGEEIPKANLGKIREHLKESMEHPRKPHVTLVLCGRFKGSKSDRDYLLPLAPKTKSGIENQKWLVRVVLGYEALGIRTGPVFRTGGARAVRARVRDLNGPFHDYLEMVQERWPRTIKGDVNVREEYSLQRSLRRGSTAQARCARVPKDVIEGNNRWRSDEAAKGGRAATFGGSMMERYTDVRAAVESLLRYSEAL